MKPLPLYTSCLFSILSSAHIIDIKQPHRIRSPAFIVDDFSGLLFLHLPIFFYSKMQDLNK